jgi:hypothetical protein
MLDGPSANCFKKRIVKELKVVEGHGHVSVQVVRVAIRRGVARADVCCTPRVKPSASLSDK